MSLHLIEKERFWKCDSCKTVHDAGRPVSSEKADRMLVCCATGIFMPSSKEEMEK